MTYRDARVRDLVRVRGSIADLDADERALLLRRSTTLGGDVSGTVAGIIDDVRTRGDAALIEMARRFDRVELASVEVARDAMDKALASTSAPERRALERAAANIARVHRAWLPSSGSIEPEKGIAIERRPDPLGRVGVYAPGGRAAYPSSVLMGVVPARIAGVREIIVASPPDESGLPPRLVLAAAALAGADRVFAIGGAGAIAAMALGTASVPRVDRIVGPGNAWVAAAKLQLCGEVAIDSPAGPSEVLVIADRSADPRAVARELVAQAEHDPLACAVAVLIERDGDDVVAAVAEAIEVAPRHDIIAESLSRNGAVVVAANRGEALEFANEYASEHLLLIVERAAEFARDLRNAGTVFVGQTSSVAFGDYMTGANHVLPTSGAARSYSGLSTLDFFRWTTLQTVSAEAASSLAGDVATLANAERLPGHARAALEASPAAVSPEQSQARASSRAFSSLRTQGVALYDGNPGARIELSDNTSRWGMPPSARDAIVACAGDAFRYPETYSQTLRRALAGKLGIDERMIVLGCGSDDVLDNAIRALVPPRGGTLAMIEPSFVMIPVFARINGLDCRRIPLTATFDADADALLASDADVIYLCSPNNPTGTSLPRATIERIVERARGLVIVDEAYHEFSGESALDLTREHGNLLVTRTFSKAYGLAGLRVGFGVGAPDLVASIARARGPFKVTSPAAVAALAALDDDGWVRERAALARAGVRRLIEGFERRGFAPLPSQANFVLVPVPNAQRVASRMRSSGIGVRAFGDLPLLTTALEKTGGAALRVSSAPDDEIAAMFVAFDKATVS